MKKLIIAGIVFVMGLGVTMSVFAAGDAAKGKAAYAICGACHGANGEGLKAFSAPRISGQHEWYIVRQLKNFKSGVRGADPKDIFGMKMRPMAMTLATDQDIADMAAYLSTLK